MEEAGCRVFGEACKRGSHEECEQLWWDYAKLVFCQDTKCLWNKQVEQKKFVKMHKGHEPFEYEAYTGICTRPELALRPKEIEDLSRKHKLTTCSCRSDKGISGHLDFSRFLTQKGLNLPDPVDPHAAYH